MRIAIISDIHGNRTAFESVLTDLRQESPDLILHGGDLPHGGSSPAEIVDRIRDLGWKGVLGNTDEMLFKPESLKEFASETPNLQPLWEVIEQMAAATCEALGEERIAWLSGLPRVQIHDEMALVHASPQTTWRAPGHMASDADLESIYAPLGRQMIIYGHNHHPYIRRVSGMTIANTGSVSLSYDGDPRASYLLWDNGKPSIRRVEYAVEKEIQAYCARGFPYADWLAKILRSARPQMLT